MVRHHQISQPVERLFIVDGFSKSGADFGKTPHALFDKTTLALNGGESGSLSCANQRGAKLTDLPCPRSAKLNRLSALYRGGRFGECCDRSCDTLADDH